MLDILACPIDKNYPLELYEIITREDQHNPHKFWEGEVTREFNSRKEVIVNEGILFCPNCYRYYPIIDEIPVMLPDELRERQKDIEFLRKWRDKIPEKIVKFGNPWHL